MKTRFCTILIPFDAEGEKRFEVLRRIAEDAGFETFRVAEYYSSGMILEEIVRSIRDAELVIADLTGGNPNVCYELGIAHALGKRVFVVAEDPVSVGVALGESAVTAFNTTPEGEAAVADSLARFIQTPGCLSPIRLFTGGTAVLGERLLLRRFAGFLLDMLFVVLLGGVVYLVLAGLTGGAWANVVPEEVSGFLPVAGILAYFVVAEAWMGATPGQRLMGLKVIRLDRGPPSLRQRILRPLAGVFSLLSLGVGFLWAAKAPRHQAVQDNLTQTLVVRSPP